MLSSIHYLPYILPTLGLDCLVLNSDSITLYELEEVTSPLSFLIYKVGIMIIPILRRTVMRTKWIYIKYLKQRLPLGTYYIAVSCFFFSYCHHQSSYLGLTTILYRQYSRYHFTLIPDKGIGLKEIKWHIQSHSQEVESELKNQGLRRNQDFSVHCVVSYHSIFFLSLYSSIYF